MGDGRSREVVITQQGSTCGIGLETGLAFGRLGADCILTHRWGSVTSQDVERVFADAAAPPPRIVQADVSSAEDTAALFDELASQGVVHRRAGQQRLLFAGHQQRRGLSAALAAEEPRVQRLAADLLYSHGRGPARHGPPLRGGDLLARAIGVPCRLRLRGGRQVCDGNAIALRGVPAERSRHPRQRGAPRRGFHRVARLHVRQRVQATRQPWSRTPLTSSRPTRSPNRWSRCAAAGWTVSTGQTIHIDRGTPFFDNAMRLFDRRERYGL